LINNEDGEDMDETSNIVYEEVFQNAEPPIMYFVVTFLVGGMIFHQTIHFMTLIIVLYVV